MESRVDRLPQQANTPMENLGYSGAVWLTVSIDWNIKAHDSPLQSSNEADCDAVIPYHVLC